MMHWVDNAGINFIFPYTSCAQCYSHPNELRQRIGPTTLFPFGNDWNYFFFFLVFSGEGSHHLLFCLEFVTLVLCLKIEAVFSVWNIQMLFMCLDNERVADV